MPLRAWLDQFGLGYQKGHVDISPEEAKRLKDQAISKAEWIKQLDKRREEGRKA